MSIDVKKIQEAIEILNESMNDMVPSEMANMIRSSALKPTDAELSYVLGFNDPTIAKAIREGKYDKDINSPIGQAVVDLFLEFRSTAGGTKFKSRLDDARVRGLGVIRGVMMNLNLQKDEYVDFLVKTFNADRSRVDRSAGDGVSVNDGKSKEMNEFLITIMQDFIDNGKASALIKWNGFVLDMDGEEAKLSTGGAANNRKMKFSDRTVDATEAIDYLKKIDEMSLTDIAYELGFGKNVSWVSGTKTKTFPIEKVEALKKILMKKIGSVDRVNRMIKGV